jgi:hypothetical protein
MSTVYLVPEEERFYKNILIMAEAIHDCVTKLFDKGYKTVDPNVVSLAVEVIGVFDRHFLIQGYIKNSHSVCWDYIHKRDEVFFVKNSSDVFQYLPMDKINLFKDLFLTKDEQGNSVVPQELKDQLWNLLSAMTKISIKYIHNRRGPYLKKLGDGTLVPAYKQDFFEDIDVKKHANTWGVVLEYK